MYALNPFNETAIGKLTWKGIWSAIKSVASVIFPVPYAVATGVYSVFTKPGSNEVDDILKQQAPINQGAPSYSPIEGIGDTIEDIITPEEKVQYKKLLQQLSPAQRKLLHNEVAQHLDIPVKAVETASKEIDKAVPVQPDAPVNPANNSKYTWLWWLGGAATVYTGWKLLKGKK